jgi:hypothetical protein
VPKIVAAPDSRLIETIENPIASVIENVEFVKVAVKTL